MASRRNKIQDTTKVDKIIDTFLLKAESLIEKDCLFITLVRSVENIHRFYLCKENSFYHNYMIKNNYAFSVNNGLVYDNTKEEVIKYMKSALVNGKSMGITIRVFLSDVNSLPVDESIYAKIYGFSIVDNLVQLNAKQIQDSYSTDCKTGKELKHVYNDIYCGYEKDDIICGFDLN